MLAQALEHVFGFSSFRAGQESVISQIMQGESACAIFPTGAGKSLCYQLPATQLPHLTLVISPLLALMHDQIAFMRRKGIAAATIDSTQTPEQTKQVMEQIRRGDIKVLMISVERLNNERFRQFIAPIPISLLVVDEAHCISEWGHNFRPDYLKLPAYREQLSIPQVLLLTATATPAVVEDMQRKFAIPSNNTTLTGFYRPNLHLNVVAVEEAQKQQALIKQLQPDPHLPTVIYVTQQQTAESVAEWLQTQHIPATAYHAGMNHETRVSIQEAFMSGRAPCIVATIAFGMGVDKADIRRVIHFDLPKSIENYSQEIGRAGRDGENATCTVLANQSSLNVLENFIYGDTPDKAAIQGVLEEIKQAGQQWEVMLHSLSRTYNIRLLPLKTLLVYLEMAGVITSQYSYFADVKFQCVASPDTITAKFQGERREFVAQLFACAVKAKTWYKMDFQQLWQRFGAERKRALKALEYFHEQGWLSLATQQATQVFSVSPNEIDVQAQTEQLHNLFAKKEESELARINQLLALLASSTCISQRLADYFGDRDAPTTCGHCSVCQGHITHLPPRPELPAIDVQALSSWCQHFAAACDETPSHAATTRFLLGLSSPLHTKIKAKTIPGFGALASYPFQTVNAHVLAEHGAKQ
ncbi:recombinase RecQ [Salinivibrio kushneri]|uniref:ATP-dependent DNA helicase RecQ n=1 Tax=Salinivibrio kushneri TaxID=1908198 RepID=A0AB36K8T1_9GAMM|nr:RecQ family ATP-dependent DNA helicase [Salinivibrio kushneri]OOE45429.1 recombinase RecQ [Salinivibrio kushneri]OOE47509.1 recombinase RecQ [Salinivibrio kushneri]